MATRETAAQRRARENKGVSARNNPFKQQDAKTKAAAPKFTPGGGGTTTGGKVDAAASNIEKLLKWIQKRVNQYAAVDVTNFTTSWEDGLALCALMNYLLGDEAIDPEKVTPASKLVRFQMAIKCATDAGVPELLTAEDLASGRMDRKSMITYLHAVYTKMFAEKKEAEKKAEEEKKE